MIDRVLPANRFTSTLFSYVVDKGTGGVPRPVSNYFQPVVHRKYYCCLLIYFIDEGQADKMSSDWEFQQV